MDQGVHDVRLLVLVGSPPRIKDTITAYADFLSTPPVAYPHLPVGSAVYKAANDFLRIDAHNLRLLALHKVSKEDKIRVRLQESVGRETNAVIEINQPFVTMKVSFRPFEIKTLEIDKAGQWRETPLC